MVGPASVQLQWMHLPGIKNATAATQPSTTILPTENYERFSLSAGYEFSETLSMRFGVDNLLNTDPPIVGAQPGITNGTGNTNPSVYDVLGRSYFLSVKAKL